MTLDPRDRKSWSGFLDLLRPPPGYRLEAAVGTAFGLSFDVLTAAAIAMMNADGEELARDPVIGALAVTRLRARVRVFVHPGTISNPIDGMPKRLVTMLDRFVVELHPKKGLFHPKVWVLRFKSADPGGGLEHSERGRIVVCSRNLTSSRSFELGATFEGEPVAPGKVGSPAARDAAEALDSWLAAATVQMPSAIQDLPAFVRRLSFDLPHECRDGLRLQWQGFGRSALDKVVPSNCGRAVVLSPFVRPDFVSRMLQRTTELRIVSTGECLDALDDATFESTEKRQHVQGTPVLYQVGDCGDPEDAFVDSIHAKLVLFENQTDSATLVGSANATGPGWGFAGSPNVEMMAELRPGITVDAFVKAFILEGKNKPHPWVTPYDRNQRSEPDPDRELERRMISALRDVAKLQLTLRYDQAQQQLRLSGSHAGSGRAALNPDEDEFTFELAPLAMADQANGWLPLHGLATGELVFGGVPMADVSAFVAVRASNRNGQMQRTRVVLARLQVSTEDLNRRDDLATQHLLAGADPAAVLHAIIRGLAHLRTGEGHGKSGGGGRSVQQLLADTSLERVMQAVAQDRSIVSDLRQLVGPSADPSFQMFCSDLEDACKTVDAEYGA